MGHVYEVIRMLDEFFMESRFLLIKLYQYILFESLDNKMYKNIKLKFYLYVFNQKTSF